MSDLDSEYRLDYFEEHGFQRKECPQCGAHFWTRDRERTTCGEPPCDEYGFIDNPGFDREHTLSDMRETFLSFFEAHGHTRVDPYPVAANRWRDDVLLTQASIYDFQPLVTSGRSPPPANPLCISQPCIRMQDIDNVGKTGRHTMAFEMMAHHAFNTREDVDPDEYAYYGTVYWKDETVEYCDRFFESLGADLEEVVYIEDPWVGGGNAGPAIEVIFRGVELATLVFMCMEQDPDGEYEMKDGNRYSMMDTYIVDTGYGLERWTWVSQGTPTVYEAIYPDMTAFLKENAGITHDTSEVQLVHRASKLAGNMDIDEVDDVAAARVEIANALDVDVDDLTSLLRPLEDIYAIADHCRTLAYMFGDGIVPSNVGSGYLARMVLRRTQRLVDNVGVTAPIDDLVDMQAERLGYDNRETIREMVRSEVEKYRETLERGARRVHTIAERYAMEGKQIPTEELIELYDSHGIQPDMVAEIAAEVDATVAIPDNFFALVAERHDRIRAVDDGGVTDDRIADLPETDALYYDDQTRTEFEAVILDVFERETGYEVVLDQTMFYPEGGGQPADHGTLSTDEITVTVTDVQKRGGVIFHRTDDDPGKGEFVRGQIDVHRRQRLMRHHTATHLIGFVTRQVLGPHVRQAGAQKGTDRARLDVQHYNRISRDEVKEIERRVNELVMSNVSVTQEWPHRNEAEERYGFDLYQGGIPAGDHIRLVHVGEDVQACGGTHVTSTGKLGAVKILSTERVQDGVERLVFAAGDAAIEATQRTEDALYEAASILDVSPPEVPRTSKRFFEEWKERGKEIETLKEQLAAIRMGQVDGAEEYEIDGTSVVVQRIDADIGALRATANALVENGKLAILGSGVEGAQFVVAVPDGSDINAGEVAAQLAERVGGGGGGPADFAQGGGPNADKLDSVLAEAVGLLKRTLNAEIPD